MSIARLLSQTADLVAGGETLDPTTRRPTPSGTVLATGIPAAATKRSDRSVIYAEDGQIVTDHDVRIAVADGAPVPQVGDRLLLTGPPAGTYLVTGETRHAIRRISGLTLFYSIPCRRLDEGG